MVVARIKVVLLLLVAGSLLVGIAHLLTRRQTHRDDSAIVNPITEYLVVYIQSVNLRSDNGSAAVKYEWVDYSSPLAPNHYVGKWYPLSGATSVCWKIDENRDIMIDTLKSDATELEFNITLWDCGRIYDGELCVRNSDLRLFLEGDNSVLPRTLDKRMGAKATYALKDIFDRNKLAEILLQHQTISNKKELAVANIDLTKLDRKGYIILPEGVFPNILGQFRIDVIVGVRLREPALPSLGDDPG